MSNSHYRTSDLNYAAYLMVAGVPFHDTTKSGDDPRRVVFLFEDQGSPTMRDLKKGYFSGKAKVSAKQYADALRTMKSLIHM